MGERYVVIGLAQSRCRWFTDVARWSTAGTAPVEFLKCLTADEVRAVLGAGRRVSAVLVDGSLPRLDRDLVAAAREAGASTIAVEERPSGRDWDAVGCAAVLTADFDRDDLTEALARHATPVGTDRRTSARSVFGADEGIPLGRLVGVTGPGGAGSSTVAMALAQAWARRGDRVALADGARRADLAMYHHVGDVIPGLPELVEAHRGDRPDPDDVRALLFSSEERGYDLLLGMRRARDWAAMRSRSVASAVEGLRRSYDLVVVDHEPDVEGEDLTGSVDVEERHAVARHVARSADLVLVVGRPGLKGVHDLVRAVDELAEAGARPDRLLPVVNRAPRSPAARAEATRAVRALTTERRSGARPLPGPLFLPHVRRLEELHWSGTRLPEALTRPLGRAASALLSRSEPDGERRAQHSPDGIVRPGELGTDTAVGAWEVA